MKYSIIVPIYNVEKYLERCIESLLKQNFDDYEVILVNDGSSDGSNLICKKYLDNNKVRYYEKKNGGLGDARNYGIERAKGEYLIFIDSDDYVVANLLECIDQAIEKYNGDVVIFNYMLVNMQDELLYIEKQFLDPNKILSVKTNKELLLIGPSACNKVFKKQLFIENNIRFPVKVWYEDLRTTAKVLACAERIVYIDEELYHYFVRPGSIMNNDNIERNLEIIEALEDLKQYFDVNFPEMYNDEFEYLAISNVLVNATGRVMSVGYNRSVISCFYNYVKNTFPHFRHHKKYLGKLNKKQKIIYYLMCMKSFRLLKILFILRHIRGER